jgi:hypothetical protein
MSNTPSRQVRLTTTSRLEEVLQFALAQERAPAWLRPVEPVFQSPGAPDSLATARATDGRCRRAFELLDTAPHQVTGGLDDHHPDDEPDLESRFEGFRVVVDFTGGAIEDVEVMATYRLPSPSATSRPPPSP